MSIEIVDYDEQWPELARLAADELRAALPGTFVELEHVGSTAIPGLRAKPVIDLMAAAREIHDVDTLDRGLSPLGYRRIDAFAPPRWFYLCDEPGRRRNLHVVSLESWPTRNERLLRDYLLAHPEKAAEYGDVKRSLAASVADMDAYTVAKTAVVQGIVDAARDQLGLPRVPVWEP